MNTERLFNIIVTDLTADKLKLEEELERVINSNVETEDKIRTIKHLLTTLATTEMSLNKFISMVGNNTKTNTQNNGEV